MYTPQHFAEGRDGVVLDLLRRSGFGHLVVSSDGLISTPVPFVVDDAVRSARTHLARPNPVGRCAPCAALLIVPVTDAYVSPGWYPSKAEHGRVVPTWNYEVVHLHGRLELHDDPEWVRHQIGDLTVENEADLVEPWAVADAPARFVEAQLGAIVGVELHIERVEAKRKLSQNRSAEDRDGVVAGLDQHNGRSRAVAEAMQRP